LARFIEESTVAKMFYSSDETVEKLGVDAGRLKELIEQNRLREFRDGQRSIFKVDQVDKLAAELKGGSGAGNLDTGPIDLAPGASGGPISLADSAAPSLSAADSKMSSKSGTGFAASSKSSSGTSAQGTKASDKSSSSIRVFDSNEVKPADTSAQTQISSALDESISPSGLDSVGSGSGLLDLTRESDNTSLGAELLEEIYPGDGGAGGSQAGVGSASGIFEQSAAGSKAGETGLGVPPPVAEPTPVPVASSYVPAIEMPDPMAGLFGGFAFASILAMLLAFITVAANLEGFVPSFVHTLGKSILMLVGLLILVTALVAIAGYFGGRASDR
jgi:hypothetical protein